MNNLLTSQGNRPSCRHGISNSVKFFVATAATFLSTVQLHAQTGTAFRDYNVNGIKDSAGEPGLPGITVRLYANATAPAKDQLIGTSVTNASGVYDFSAPLTGRGANAGEKVRVEFEIPLSAACNTVSRLSDYSSEGGANYGTAVQFVTGAESGVDFAVNYPGEFSKNPDPELFVPCYVNGNPLAGGNAGSTDAFVKFPFSASGRLPAYGGTVAPTKLATSAQIGSTYGVAYSRQAKTVFTSAFLKRHVGLGPLGPGGIYRIDPATATVTNFLDLHAIGINTSDTSGAYQGPTAPSNVSPASGVIGTNVQRGLAADFSSPSADAVAYDQVGKVSIGDLDISDDGRYLYLVNLYDRKIYEIDLVDPFNPQAPTNANKSTRVRSWSTPDPGTTAAQGEHRPFGLAYYRDKVYVGTVLSGQAADGTTVGTTADLSGYIHTLDRTTGAFTEVLNFPMSYRIEAGWYAWRKDFSGDWERGVPILGDIAFYKNGEIIVGMMDRWGHQMGWINHDLTGNGGYSVASQGDTIRFNPVEQPDGSCTYSLIALGGGGEFYNDNLFHSESSQGALAILPGGGDVVSTALDPLDIWSGGLFWYNNDTGARNRAYELFYQPGGNVGSSPGKANGLGDIELSGDIPSIELGNRIWLDVDQDGVQDGDEPGIPGVNVELYKAGTLVGTTTTNAAGEYYFNSSNVTQNGAAGILPSMAYEIRLTSAQYNTLGVAGTILEGTTMTTANVAGSGLADYSDSDSTMLGGVPVIALTTGINGDNNHTYDMGFTPAASLGSYVWEDNNRDGIQDGGEPAVTGAVVSLFKADGSPATNVYGTAVAAQTTLANGKYFFGNLPQGQYFVRVTPPAGLARTPVQSASADNNIANDSNITNAPASPPPAGSYHSGLVTLNTGAEPVAPTENQVGDDADDFHGGIFDSSGNMTVDFGFVPAYDLALTKVLAAGQSAEVSIGQDVTFTITVFNQSAASVRDIVVRDYLPAGLGLNDGDWTVDPGDATAATISIPGPLAAGDSTTVDITLITNGAAFGAMVNYSEIESFKDAFGGSPPDVDSTPDTDRANDAGGAPGTAADNAVNGNGTGAIGGTSAAGDEDDHDPALVTVSAYSLGNLVWCDDGREDGEPNDGIRNGGEIGIANVLMELLDAAGNPVIRAGNPVTTMTNADGYYRFDNLQPGQYAVRVAASNFGGGRPLQGFTSSDGVNTSYTTAENNVDHGPDLGLVVSSLVQLGTNDPLGEVDPGATGAGANGAAGDLYDNLTVDFGFYIIFDVSLQMSLAPGQDNEIAPGENVKYQITVSNQGSVSPTQDLANVKVNDTIPAGFIFDSTLNTAAALGNVGVGNWNLVSGKPQINIPSLPAGATRTFLICLTAPSSLGGGKYKNSASIGDVSSTNGKVATIFDRSDITADNEIEVVIYDLALRKTLADGQANPVQVGDTVKFDIEIFNQGTKAMQNVKLVDYIPAGLSLNTLLSPNWVDNGNGTASGMIVNPIAPGESAQVTITFNVAGNAPADSDLINFAEIQEMQNMDGDVVDDIDSTPDNTDDNDGLVTDNEINNDNGDEDDHDPASVTTAPLGRFDLALRKTLANGQSGTVNPGDNVIFAIEVFNQGTISANNVQVTDYLQAGFVWPASPALNPNWSYNAGSNTASVTLLGSIAPAQSSTVLITLQVDPALNRNAVSELFNYSEISNDNNPVGNPDFDSTDDSNPSNDGALTDDAINNENADQDDHDVAKVGVNPFDRFDLALRKTLAAGQSSTVNPGDNVSFTIEVFNQGAETAPVGVQITDYLQTGFVWPASATLNPNWVYTAGSNTAAVSLSNALAPGTSASVTLVLQVDPALNAATAGRLNNFAEISVDQDPTGNGDDDSTPDSNPGNDGALTDDAINNENADQDDHDIAFVDVNEPQSFDLALRKTLAANQSSAVNPADIVEFSIEVFNQGAVAASNVQVTDYLQPGFVWPANGALNPGWVYSGGSNSALATIAATINPGTSATLTIRLQVDPNVNPVVNMVLYNFSEISNDNHPTANGAGPDVDSTPDNNQGNDGPLSDNAINNENGDQDDHDIAQVTVNHPGLFDLALRKTLANGQASTVNPGDIVSFNVEVFNQGAVAATDVQITDYLQAGFVWPADASLNPNWAYAPGLNVASAILPGTIAPGASATAVIKLQVNPAIDAASVSTIYNYAEISVDNHPTSNGAAPDVDSTPDGNNANDGVLTDNAINNENADEDDHDIAQVGVNPPQQFDLALRKTLAANQSSSVNPSDLVEFTIEVFNQGAVDASDVQVTDYLQAGFVWPANGALNPGWAYTAGSNTAAVTIPGVIAAGSSATVTVRLQVDPAINAAAAGNIFNYAEISVDNHPTGNGAGPDVDSTPDNNQGNDGALTDNAINNENGDQDDHDIAQVSVNPPQQFDLALRKTLADGQSGTVNAGDIVEFTIEVFNQGSVSTSNVQVTDYLQTGFVWPAAPALNPNWVYSAGTNSAAVTIPGVVAPGASVTTTVRLQVNPAINAATAGTLYNFSEISVDNHPTANGAGPDVDSTPDNNQGNDGALTDNAINNENGDQDDHDVAQVVVNQPEQFDLALRKQLAQGQNSSVNPGDIVEFTLEIFNQGAVDANDVQVTDYLQAGFVWPANAALNPGWVYSAGTNTAAATIPGVIAAGESVTTTIKLQVNPAINAATAGAIFNYAEISVDNHPTANGAGPDIDSTPDSSNANDGVVNDDEINNGNGDQDDHDIAQVNVNPPQTFDLALRKQLAQNQNSSVNAGDIVEFTIEVFNQGAVAATNVEITDYLQPGFVWPANAALNADWAFSAGKASTTLTGTIAPGASATSVIRLQVDPAINAAAIRMVYNFAEISDDNHPTGNGAEPDPDSTPDDTNGNDGPVDDDAINNENADEDDHDVAEVLINLPQSFDLALRKTLAAGQTSAVQAGAIVEFTVEVFNQGAVAATNVQVTDYLQAGFVWPADASLNPNWVYTAATNKAKATLAGTIAPSASATTTIKLQVDPAINAATTSVIYNYSEISIDNHPTANGAAPDVDSTPDDSNSNDGVLTDNAINNENADEDDHDIAQVNVTPPQAFDLALRKQLAETQSSSVNPGDYVEFTIEVFNQGDVAATNVEVIDYLQSGFVWPANSALNPGWAYNGGTNTATTTLAGAIAPGQSATTTVLLQVNPAINAALVGTIYNYSEISVDNHPTANGAQPDVDSTPDSNNGNDGALTDDAINNENSDQDDHDIAQVNVNPPQQFDLALRKTLADAQSAQVNPGDIVEFTIEVFNQGSVAANNVQVTDYLQTGFVWPASPALNPNWVYSAGSNSAVVTIPGVVAPGASVTTTVRLQVNPAINALTAGALYNFAEISTDNHPTANGAGPDVDSTPDNNQGNDGALTDNAINNENGDQDDHDVAQVVVNQPEQFDLALRKQLAQGQNSSVNPGDIVEFTIEIFNQGAVDANDVQVTDYLQAGFVWPANAALNPGWVYSAGTNTAAGVVPGVIAAGESVITSIKLQVNPAINALNAGKIFNYAEISVDNHPTANGAQPDIDSTPDNSNTNDGVVNDDEINNGNGDQDDHDIANVSVNPPQTFDLALRKQLAELQNSSVNPGDIVEFTIEVFNQGAVAATNVEITDYLQPGFVWPANGALNPDWAFSAGKATTTLTGTIAPSASATSVIRLQVDPALNAATTSALYNFAEISDDNHPTGNGAEPDPDSTPDDNNGNDGPVDDDEINNSNADEDDHDIAQVGINPPQRFDLALRKTLAANQTSSVEPGDIVEFTVEVFNQGAVAANDVQVTDYLQAGFVWPADVSLNPNWVYTAATNKAKATLAGTIAPSASASTTIKLQVDPAINAATTSVIYNYSEISIDNHPTANGAAPDVDSMPDDSNSNDGVLTDNAINNENADEDDHDIAQVGVIAPQDFDLALRKTLANGQSVNVNPGDLVHFTVEIFNQGDVTATNVEVTDYIQTGFVWPTNALLNSNWTTPAGGKTSVIIPGPIAAGQSAAVSLWLQVDPALNRNVINGLRNYAEISDDNHPTDNGAGPDIDSTPDDNNGNDGAINDDAINNENGDQDDHDIADIVINPFDQFDLALRKTLATGQSGTVNPGDIVEFTIEVFNQGSMDASDVVVTDYIQSGFVFPASAALNPNWSAPVANKTTVTIPGVIAAGQSASVTLRLQVNPALDRNAVNRIYNFAEISADNHPTGNGGNPDVDSDPDNNGGNDGAVTDDAINNENADEDDHDGASVDINPFGRFDLALRKTLALGQNRNVNPGDVINFNIEIFNQGAEATADVVIVDYVPVGLIFESALAPGWSYDAATRKATTTVIGALAPAQSVMTGIKLRLDPAIDRNAVRNITNIAEILDDKDPTDNGDDDSNPDGNPGNDGPPVDDEINNGGWDEDDQDPETINVNPFGRYDLALRKQLAEDQNSSVNPGDMVKFTIEVFNQGSEIAPQGVQITDYVQNGFVWPANASMNPGWVYNAATRKATTSLANAVAPSTSYTLVIWLQVDPALNRNLVRRVYNYAEISIDQHPTGNGGNPDIDSTPDDTNGNDGAVNDDAINNELADQDDHDIAGVDINPFGRFDLALRKTLALDQSRNVNPGDLVHFRVELFNQGAEPATNVVIVDYVPVGLIFEQSENPGWSYVAATRKATATVQGTLVPGESAAVSIKLRVDPALDRVAIRNLRNFAEIQDDKDPTGNGDDDSDPDNNPDNDGPPVDDEINNGGGDQDDHDGELIDINPWGRFDLALRKQLAPNQTPKVKVGDNVQFVIEIFNQGEVAAQNVVIVDYVPVGFLFESLSNPGWSYDAATRKATALLNGTLAPSTSKQALLILKVDPLLDTSVVTQLTNTAEILVDNHPITNGGNPDIDSTPDGDIGNDGIIRDDEINNVNGDQDDHDIAIVQLDPPDRCDLAIRKTLAPGQDYNVKPGEAVYFNLEVINQGARTMKDIKVCDYLPAGLNFEQVPNPDWTNEGTVNGVRQVSCVIRGPLAPGATQTLRLCLRVDIEHLGGIQRNCAEICAMTSSDGRPCWGDDSVADNVPNNDGQVTNNAIHNENFDEDDHDCEEIYVIPPGAYDLALRKQPAIGQSLSVNPGDRLKFTIEIFNQGNEPLKQVQIVDYVPPQLELDDYNWFPGATPNSVVGMFNGTIQPGDSVKVDIWFRVKNTPAVQGQQIRNYAEIMSARKVNGQLYVDVDSTPDDIIFNDGFIRDDEINGVDKDEDDQDIAVMQVNPAGRFDLALRKTLKTGQSPTVKPGDTVCYTIEIFNQGAQDARNVVMCDYIPTGMTLAPGSMWTMIPGTNTAKCLIVGPIPPGMSAPFEICLVVGANTPAGLLRNCAEICEAKDANNNAVTDADSTMDAISTNDGQFANNEINNFFFDEDDHDCEDVTILPPGTYDLALRKTLATGQKNCVNAGDQVCYTIEVFNQGTETAYGVKVCDYLPAGMSFNAAANPGWSYENAGTISCVFATPLAPGASRTIGLCMTVNADVNAATIGGGTGNITNCAEICEVRNVNGQLVSDPDSTPDGNAFNDGKVENDNINNANGDEDDHDCEAVKINPPAVFDLALRKGLAITQSASAAASDNVTFSIEVFNQGQQAASAVKVVDYLPAGVTLNDPLWQLSGNQASYTIPGTIAVGGSAKVNITVTINSNFVGTSLTNRAEIVQARNEENTLVTSDVDGAFDSNADNDGFVIDDELNGLNGDADDTDLHVFPINPGNSIGNLVWHDLNDNGLQDAGEPGLAGVTVRLLDAAGNPTGLFDITDGSGHYSFDQLAPGNYRLEFVSPDGFLYGTRNAGTNDNIDSDVDPLTGLTAVTAVTTIDAGELDHSWDAGFISPATISGSIYADNDNDGDGDIIINEVTLGLFDAAGNTVDNPHLIGTQAYVITTADGRYAFTGLKPGSYVVKQTQPAGYITVTDLDNTADLAGSPADATNSSTSDNQLAATVKSGETDNGNDFVERLVCAESFAQWRANNALNGSNGNAQNPDNDMYSNLLEYAFCMSPTSGANNAFCLVPNANGVFEIEFSRVLGGLTDTTFCIRSIADLAQSPSSWSEITLADLGGLVSVTPNADGFTETVRVTNVRSLLPGGAMRGFFQIGVKLDSNGDGLTDVTDYTEVQGFQVVDVESGECETYSVPFIEKPVFSGKIDDVQGLVISATEDINFAPGAGTLNAGSSYRIEITSGDRNGHRFPIASAVNETLTVATDADVCSGAPYSSFNTTNGLPADLTGASFVIVRDQTLNEMAPISLFHGTNSSSSADRVLYPNGTGGWIQFWAYQPSTGAARWVRSGSGLTSQNNVTFAANQAVFVHPRQAGKSLVSYGMVRSSAFASPLCTGTAMIGAGYPVDMSPAQFRYTPAQFLGTRSSHSAEQMLLWTRDGFSLSDQDGYTGYWLFETATQGKWLKVGETNLTGYDNTKLVRSGRGHFFRALEDHREHVYPRPWTPATRSTNGVTP